MFLAAWFILLLPVIALVTSLSQNPTKDQINKTIERRNVIRDEYIEKYGIKKEESKKLEEYILDPKNWGAIYEELHDDLVAIWGEDWKTKFDFSKCDSKSFSIAYESWPRTSAFCYAKLLMMSRACKMPICDIIGGFYTGKPMDYDTVIKVLQRVEENFNARGVKMRLVVPCVTLSERLKNADKSYYQRSLVWDCLDISPPLQQVRLWDTKK